MKIEKPKSYARPSVDEQYPSYMGSLTGMNDASAVNECSVCPPMEEVSSLWLGPMARHAVRGVFAPGATLDLPNGEHACD
ncbi:MAG: hypothetical protein AAF141_15590 [Pseudomonadota bacterium]